MKGEKNKRNPIKKHHCIDQARKQEGFNKRFQDATMFLKGATQ
jgi:hypothetical protein